MEMLCIYDTPSVFCYFNSIQVLQLYELGSSRRFMLDAVNICHSVTLGNRRHFISVVILTTDSSHPYSLEVFTKRICSQAANKRDSPKDGEVGLNISNTEQKNRATMTEQQ